MQLIHCKMTLLVLQTHCSVHQYRQNILALFSCSLWVIWHAWLETKLRCGHLNMGGWWHVIPQNYLLQKPVVCDCVCKCSWNQIQAFPIMLRLHLLGAMLYLCTSQTLKSRYRHALSQTSVSSWTIEVLAGSCSRPYRFWQWHWYIVITNSHKDLDPLILTLKTATQSVYMTLHILMVHQHTTLHHKVFSTSELRHTMDKINIQRGFESSLTLWPWY